MHRLIHLGSVAFFLASALPAAVEISLNGKPATPGDYKPADVHELTLRNGLLAIAFGPDGSATSLINTIRLAMTAVGKNGGIMYDTIKLELE